VAYLLCAKGDRDKRSDARSELNRHLCSDKVDGLTGPVISLARLRRSQGRTQEAHELLSSVYSVFKEGFETSDLMAARQLIEELR
jgi:hypothetical protein